MTTSPFTLEALSEKLDQLATFTAPGPGVTRLVYDEHWCDAHLWLQAEARALGLAATCDAIGNLWLHDPGLMPGTRVIAVGSHLDSVRQGGRFDGAYGTIAALLLAAELRGSATPVAAFVTCEEEGSRFPMALTGVRGLLGQLVPSRCADQRDRDGVRWADALASARARGCAAEAPPDGAPVPKLFNAARQLELHIEQGPVLESMGAKLGVVDTIAGYRRVRARLTGEARHAGTTPMDRRRDALAAAAEIVLAAEALGLETGAPAVATAGGASAEPGLYNVVPGTATLLLEVRHTDDAALVRMEAALGERARAIAARRGVAIELEVQSGEAATPLSAALADQAEAMAAGMAIPYRRMASGAGHDTMAFAQDGVPALMLFTPSRLGISHHPDELTKVRDLWVAAAFARELLLAWAKDLA
ncbi:MAG: hydantoinase/carbamoylase family amidase [Candidatus Eisenbacteria bacterium]|uniref:Hydantoinase/carbamoylase family amidase n=1 Tax=Eiseniibacteriota bacterium TaxID=2212470 RepID=A0A933SGW8_UNCEI|nr:hydantoinase/carbamoylase family amidase [Candidatus Eisenbacteria bacterium]